MNNTDRIRLSFPVNSAYVSSARLTASSIANRIKFDIDEIEDMKTAVSEACTYIIKRSAGFTENHFEICFLPGPDEMTVEIVAQDSKSDDWPEDPDEEMSLMMIKALVDKFEISKEKENHVTITMVKKHKETSFE